MTRKRVTKEEKEQRQRWAVAQIDKGVGFSELTSLTSETWGVSRSQGYRLIKRAWRQIHDDIEGPDLDRQEMLAWCVKTLLETAGLAKAQRNPGAVVAAIRQLDWMCGLGINSQRGYSVHRRPH